MFVCFSFISLQSKRRQFQSYQQSTESSISTRDVSRFSLDDTFKSSLADPTPAWNINKNKFNVFEAVPNNDNRPTDERLRIPEHVYTISEEDLRDTADAVDGDESDDITTQFVGRRQFRACHSACVQSSCLPVTEVARYSQCVSECKQSC